MARAVEHIALNAMSPGSTQHLTVFRYGTIGARPKAYLQAAMHADEPPGILVLHHLCRLLDAADRQGGIRGEIVVVPTANPIGLDQVINTTRAGRHEFRSGINFNRGFPDLGPELVDRTSGRLTQDPARNIAIIRAELQELQAARKPLTALARLQLELQKLAIDADLVIDLHCDDEAEAYLMAREAQWPEARQLAADVGVRWLLESGASTPAELCFDESCIHPWAELRQALGAAVPVPLGCLAVCFEMRGINAVDDAVNARDAAGLLRYLVRRGLVAGDAGVAAAESVETAPAYEYIDAPKAGLVVYAVPLGSRVKAGDLVAELVDPLAEDQARGRLPLRASVAGAVISRCLARLVAPGDFVAMIVGQDWPKAPSDGARTLS
jgi:uncharacterized protein